jgi:hypothetical protein
VEMTSLRSRPAVSMRSPRCRARAVTRVDGVSDRGMRRDCRAEDVDPGGSTGSEAQFSVGAVRLPPHATNDRDMLNSRTICRPAPFSRLAPKPVGRPLCLAVPVVVCAPCAWPAGRVQAHGLAVRLFADHSSRAFCPWGPPHPVIISVSGFGIACPKPPAPASGSSLTPPRTAFHRAPTENPPGHFVVPQGDSPEWHPAPGGHL